MYILMGTGQHGNDGAPKDRAYLGASFEVGDLVNLDKVIFRLAAPGGYMLPAPIDPKGGDYTVAVDKTNKTISFTTPPLRGIFSHEYYVVAFIDEDGDGEFGIFEVFTTSLGLVQNLLPGRLRL